MLDGEFFAETENNGPIFQGVDFSIFPTKISKTNSLTFDGAVVMMT